MNATIGIRATITFSQGRPIIIDDLRVRAKATASKIQIHKIASSTVEPQPESFSNCYFEGLGRYKTPVYILAKLHAGVAIRGPAIVIDNTNTIVVENDCTAHITEYGDIKIIVGSEEAKKVR